MSHQPPTPRMLAALALAALAAVVACAVLGACGSRSESATRLELWALGREGEVVAQMMPDFELRNPGVHVHVQQIPWSAAHEKLLTAYVGDAMPDVFQVGNTWIPEFAALGALESLDERIHAAGDALREDSFPGILDTNVIDGKTYAVPWYVDTRLLFYRSDLLAAAGSTGSPKSWESWRGAMERAKQKAAPGAFAVLLTIQEWQPLVILAMQQNATLLRDGDLYGDFQSPAFRKAFEFYIDLFRAGLAPLAGQAEVANLYQEFARGTFVFYVSGPWNVGEFSARLPPDLAGRWTTAPMPSPAGDGVGVSLAGGASLAVFRGSSKKDAAWSLVRYLSEPAQQSQLYKMTGDLPARRRAWETDGGPGSDPRVAAFRAQLENVRSTPKIPEWERIAQQITRYTEAVLRRQMTTDEALAALDRNVDAMLAKRRWMKQRESGGES